MAAAAAGGMTPGSTPIHDKLNINTQEMVEEHMYGDKQQQVRRMERQDWFKAKSSTKEPRTQHFTTIFDRCCFALS